MSEPSLEQLGMIELRDAIADYLREPNENNLERFEFLAAVQLIILHSDQAVTVWDYVNTHPDRFGLRKVKVQP